MDLLKELTGGLGITDDQAKGGAGMLFQLAREKLDGDEFKQVSAAVPGMDDLLKAGKSAGGGGGILGGLASAVGAGGLGDLAGGFSKLGLDSGMIGKFIPIILSSVQSKGGNVVKGLLEKALK